MNELTVSQFDLSPRTIDEALKFADMVSKSGIVPKDFQNNAGNIFVAIQWGMELGLKPMQAMQNIAVINGRPSLWGDAVIALVKSSPLCEYIYETIENGVATCRVKRKGEDEQIKTFSEADAKAAGLIGKQGPWSQYPKRMLQMRARAFALRDVFPDVLKGMPIAEEVMDYEEKEINPAPKPEQKPEPKALPTISDEEFMQKFPALETGIKSGRKTADQVIQTLQLKYTVTESQVNAIRSVPAPINGEAEVIPNA